MGKLKKLSEEQVNKSVAMYQSGMSLQKIANHFSVSRQSMWDLLRRKIPLRSNIVTGSNNRFYRGGRVANDRAQNLLEKAIKRGEIQRKTICENCSDSGTFKDGRTKIQAHHPDYNKPLDVIWLCQRCHHEWHKQHRAIGESND